MSGEKFILGIYNYCDRWCEKCDFSTKCLVFSKEVENKTSIESDDQIWDNISNELKDTLDILKDILEEEGINIDEILNGDNDKDVEEYNKKHEDAKNSDYCILSEKYHKQVDELLKKIREKLSLKQDIVNKQIDLGIDIKEFETFFDNIDCFIEIVTYYQFFIYIKLLRATEEKYLVKELEELHLHHFNGTAKIALIAIQKSIDSWRNLLSMIPELQDEIIDILAILQKILKKAENEFPGARNFIRPGFDE
jgi:hypothetical protein